MSGQQLERIGGFRILERLQGGAEGNQGTVYRAVCEEPPFDTVEVGEVVAIKTMSVPDDDGTAYAKFEKRTRIIASLDHPNIVRYRGCFCVSEAFALVHVLVMDCLEGETLKERLEKNPGGLDADDALRIIDGAAAGLEAAAAKGIVHRDVKPANVFLCKDGSVKIIDFEISLNAEGTASTPSGRFLGTFDYMAPEFLDAAFRGDETSDVFSLGVVLHESLTGKTPYVAAEKKSQADFAFLSRWSRKTDEPTPIHIHGRVERLLAHGSEFIGRVLSVDREERISSFSRFRSGLKSVRFRDLRNGANTYRLVRVVGKGGFGEVFKARHLESGEFVAVKHLLKATYGDRFRREAKTMARFRDPCFTRFVDYFEVERAGEREAFLVMAFLPGMPGSSLRDAIKALRGDESARLDGDEVLRAFRRYAHGLAVMHREGVFHRDIKPSNLYYPKGRPDDAVIMDLGIVRDVHGTVTTGQVPGTLDYMPPEIIDAGSRGDSGMDVYALGLCLYEALTGKTGYPRLPTGQTAFAAFYQRAAAKKPPVFDDPEILKRPKLLELLRKMTSPVRSRRLADAAVIERICATLTWKEAKKTQPEAERIPTTPKPAPVRRTRSRPSERPRVQEEEPRTVGTAALAKRLPIERLGVGRFLDRPEMRGVFRGIRRATVALAGLLVVAGVVWFVGPYAKDAWCRMSTARDRLELERRIDVACASALVVSNAYANATDLKLPDAAAANWFSKWQVPSLPQDVYEAVSNVLTVARLDCADRLQREREVRELRNAMRRADHDADAVRVEYLNNRVDSADALRGKWELKWAGAGLDADFIAAKTNDFADARARCLQRIEDAKNRRLLDMIHQKEVEAQSVRATNEASRICADYAAKGRALGDVDAARERWRNDHASIQGLPLIRSARERIESARRRRELRESERRVVSECRKLLDNIRRINIGHVENWRNYIKLAEIELDKGIAAGTVSEQGAEEVRKGIHAVSKWAVGGIENRTHERLELMDWRIEPTSSGVYVFTNGVPEGIVIAIPGYESIPLHNDRFDGQVVQVTNARLVPMRGACELEVPKLPADVVCTIDGVPCASGKVSVREGSHECVYRNTTSTYEGCRDFEDQRIGVETTRGCRIRLAPPGPWVNSSEFVAARKNSEQSKRGDEIEAKCRELLKPEPIDTRRRRLEQAWSLLSDFRSAQQLGDARMRKLRGDYEAERSKVIGRVVNETDLRIEVRGLAGGAQVVAPHSRETVVYDEGRPYDNGLPNDARVAVHGYADLSLPKARDFDGHEFIVTMDKLDPLPMKVSLPELERGVTCAIAGNAVKSSIDLKPGFYICVYSKDGFADQRKEFEVVVGKPLTLPEPGKWEQTGFFGRFVDTMRDATDSSLRGMQKAVKTVTTIERNDGVNK